MATVEEMIVKAVDLVKEDEVVEFGSQLASIPSFKHQDTLVADWLKPFFEERGYEVHYMQVWEHVYQCIAVLKGTGGGRNLMLNGHIDVDRLPQTIKDPFTAKVEGNKLCCHGLFNMKGGVTSAIMAAEAVRKSGVTLKGDLIVAPVAMELCGGNGTLKLIEEKIIQPGDLAIVAEPYGADRITTTTGGAVAFSVICRSTYTTADFRPTFNPYDKLEKVVRAIREMRLTHEPWDVMPDGPQLELIGVHAATGENFDSDSYGIDTAKAQFFIWGIGPDMTDKGVIADITRVIEELKQEDPEILYEIEYPTPPYMGGWMPASCLPEDSELVKVLDKNYTRVMGKDVVTIGPATADGSKRYGAEVPSDNNWLTNSGIEAVLFGPTGQSHTKDEVCYINIDEMVSAAKVMAATAIDVCNTEK